MLGTRGIDALRAADFLFPHGIDHHRLFAGIRGVSGVVQSFARRVAGLGTLPDEVAPIRDATRLAADVLIVGGGPAGLAAAAELTGARVILVDDAPNLGGSLRALGPTRVDEILSRLATVDLRGGTTAVALLREPEQKGRRLHAILLGPEGATQVDARAVIVATGSHDPVLPFGNNDLPGVISARAALLLWQAGIAVGERALVVGRGPYADAFAALSGSGVEVGRVEASALLRAMGRTSVSAVLVRDASGEKKLRTDAVLIDGAGPPAMELAVQAGATPVFDAERGHRLELGEDGAAAPGLWCAGSVAALGNSAADGARVGRAVKRALGG